MRKHKNKVVNNLYRIVMIILVISLLYVSQDRRAYFAGITLLGVYFVFNGIKAFLSRKRYILNSTQIEGVVVDLVREAMRGGATTYRPVIEYFDKVDSLTKKHISNNGYFHFIFKKGQIVKLRRCYDDTNEEIYIDTWFDIWGYSIFSVLLGSCLLAIGLINLT